jgi:hypothetical protein
MRLVGPVLADRPSEAGRADATASRPDTYRPGVHTLASRSAADASPEATIAAPARASAGAITSEPRRQGRDRREAGRAPSFPAAPSVARESGRVAAGARGCYAARP